MHDTSYATMGEFVRVHLDGFETTPLEVLDFGSQMVDGHRLSYLDFFGHDAWNYRGLDIEAGNNVDIVVSDAYDWPEVASDSIDVVISGQALEHVEYFWASIFEIVRVLKPGGVAAIIAPSGGFEHRYPVDCWRFYRDGFTALCRYVGADRLDVFTDWNHGEWDDSILVLQKPEWNGDERHQFAIRSAMQRALIGDDPTAFDPDSAATPPPPSTVSALSGRRPGALTEVLESQAADRVEAEHAERTATAAQQAADQQAEVDRLVAERLHGITPLRWYGSARQAVAGLVGERGRGAYRRLRGRA